MTTLLVQRPLEEKTLELPPARWQLWAVPLASGVGLGTFAAVCWSLMVGPWRWVFPPTFAAYGLLLARLNHRRLRATRVHADDSGLRFDDGTRAGRCNQHVLWDDVALCVVEQRYTSWGGEVGGTSNVLILKGAGG